MAQARELGAEHVINYQADPEWWKTVFHMTGRRGVDVIVDNVGAVTWAKSIRAVARGGRILTVGATTGPIGETDIRYVYNKQITIIGSTMGTRDELASLVQMLDATGTKPLVDRSLPMHQAADGFAAMAEGDVFGKIVFTR